MGKATDALSRVPFFASSRVALCFVCLGYDSIDIKRFMLFLISNLILFLYNCVSHTIWFIEGWLKKTITPFSEIIGYCNTRL
jgi:hypothetical protein